MNLEFSDEPLPTAGEDFDQWEPAPEFAPPPPAGKYRGYLALLREESEFTTIKGKRYRAVVDLRITGGQYDERAVTWQRLSNAETERNGRRSSMLLDLLRCAKVSQPPRSNADYSRMMHALVERGAGMFFGFQLDWRGFCTSCNERKLMQMTERTTPDAAKEAASDDQKRTAAKFATKAKNYRGFPPALANGGPRVDHFKCPDCGETVQAQCNIQRFFPGEEV